MSEWDHARAVLRNALSIAEDFPLMIGASHAAADYVIRCGGMFDDGLDALRARLVGASDPAAEIVAELARLDAAIEAGRNA